MPRRKCRRQVAPPTTGAHNIKQAVQHKPHIGRPGPTTRLGRRDERLDQAVLVIAQGLTGTKVSNQGAGIHIGDLHQKSFPSIQPSLHLITITQDGLTTFSNGL